VIMYQPQLVDLTELAIRSEAACHRRCKGVGKEYNAKVRDLRFNLTDSKHLSNSLYLGELLPESMATMSSADLANPDLKKTRAAERKYNADAKRSDYNVDAASTDMFQCEKCRQFKCTYFQMQTRGADEPMTIFVTCLVCGYKFRSGDNA